MSTLTFLFNIVLKVLTNSIGLEKEIKAFKFERKILSLFIDSTIFCIEKSQGIYKKVPRFSEFGKVAK